MMLNEVESQTMNDQIIDAHVHLPTGQGLCTLEQKRERLLRDMARDRVDRCVLISDSELESEIGSMDECVRLFAGDGAVRVVGGISPLIGFDAQLERLKRHILSGRISGIKLFPGHEGYYLSDPRLEPVWRLAEARGVPALFHSGWDDAFYADPREVRAVLEAHAGLKLVCCHCFYPELEACLGLTDLPGLMFDLSSIADQPERIESLVPLVRALIERVPERVMFGSDYACCEREPHLKMMARLALPDALMEKVMWGNALSLYFTGGIARP